MGIPAANRNKINGVLRLNQQLSTVVLWLLVLSAHAFSFYCFLRGYLRGNLLIAIEMLTKPYPSPMLSAPPYNPLNVPVQSCRFLVPLAHL